MASRGGLTAAQVIVLAADDLFRASASEFTEWDLTVASWKRDQNRFGLRGYEGNHPDHKRVMMEIMGKTKKDNPIRRGFLEKTRPNHYRITDLGRAEAAVLESRSSPETLSAKSPQELYNAISQYTDSKAFRSWLRDSNEPRSWLGASSFLDLTRNTANELNDRVRAVRHAVQRAEEWCRENGRDALRSGASGGSKAIPLVEIRKLIGFLDTIDERFARQLAALRQKSS